MLPHLYINGGKLRSIKSRSANARINKAKKVSEGESRRSEKIISHTQNAELDRIEIAHAKLFGSGAFPGLLCLYENQAINLGPATILSIHQSVSLLLEEFTSGNVKA